MSGIAGIVQFDGAPVEARLIRTLTDFLTHRGPDRHCVWLKGNIGFGHALFKTTEESEWDFQPLTLGGGNWVVADARIDDREQLIADLKSGGQPDVPQNKWTDAELILRAYEAWNEQCVEHLLGDFAFAVWDAWRQQLFCARDHMGVKPLYYAHMGSSLIFSNTLDCLRQHSLVSDKLNRLALADFLLFGVNQDSASTSFQDIRRIPPAHCLIAGRDGLCVRRYWAMPIDEPVFYERAEDYTSQFQQLLNKCVSDRLRSNSVSIFMSGGLDSPTLAVAAQDILQQRYEESRVSAMTQIDSFVPEESYFAQLVANQLKIPIDYHDWTRLKSFQWEQLRFALPEPHIDACLNPSRQEFWSTFGSCPRVFLYGEGPDNALLFDWKSCLRHVAEEKRFALLARSAISTLLADRRPPFWGRISKTIDFSRHAATNAEPRYPHWINGRLESSLQLRERWKTIHSQAESAHSIRPKAYASLHIPRWQAMFESFNFGWHKNAFEVRHPFADIRMLRFLLSLPAMPWCRNKYLLRKAMQGRLPNEVLRRRKATPRMDLVKQFMARFCEKPFRPACGINEFVDPKRFAQSLSFEEVENNLRVRSLNHWLQNLYDNSHNSEEGIARERNA